MAKKKVSAPPVTKPRPAKPEPPQPADPAPLTPRQVCTLLGLPDPTDPPKPPPPWPGYATIWDPGRSIVDLKRRHPALFYPLDWYDGLAFAKAADGPRWRQLRLRPIGPGEAFADQAKVVPKGDEVPLARDVVTFLLVRFLATGERSPGLRLRCRDVLSSGRRVVVGPFWDAGLDLANCGDGYRSVGVGLASANVPPPRR